jgi:PAS domain S-box-containing protein
MARRTRQTEQQEASAMAGRDDRASDRTEGTLPAAGGDAADSEHRRSLEAMTRLITDLAGIRDLDNLCRAAVERGHKALDVRRMALWFRTEDPAVIAGTYGIDEHGRLRDERASRVHVSDLSLMGQVLFRGKPTVMRHDVELRNDHGVEVGRGDAVIAAITAEQDVLGCICADNLRSGRPIDALQADRLFLFGAAFGQIWRRVKAEQEAAEFEARYRRLFETAQDAIVIFDPATRRILDANESWLRLYGCAREELPALNIFSFSAEPESSIDAFLQALGSRTRYFAVRQHRKRDGTVFPTEVSAAAFPMGGRNVVCGVARDVSERVRAEAALRKAHDELDQRVRERTADLVNANQTLLVEVDQRRRAEKVLRANERRFRAIFNSTFQFIGLLTTDGILIEVNQTALDAAGIRAEDVLNRPFADARWWAISAETRRHLTEAIAQAARGEPVRFEVDILGKGDRVITIDFSLRPILDEHGQVTLLVPEGHDITDRKHAEEALRHSEDRLRLTARAAHIGAFDFDVAAGRLEWSREFRDLLGLPPETPADIATFYGRVHPDDLERVQHSVARSFGHPGDSELEYRVVWPDGSVHWIMGRASALAGPDGKVVRVLGVLADVTELRHAQLEAAEQKQAVQYQQMETLVATGRMAAGVAHEINNPLQGIVAQLRLLADELPPDLRDSKRLRLIHSSVKRISDVVASLLNIHRPPREGETACPAAAVIGSVTELIGAMAASRGVRIETALRPKDLVLPMSPNALTQVLLNLCLNGIDAMPAGGLLRIEALRGGKDILLRVSDTGGGILPENRSKLFSPFFTTKGPRGTGLGLSVTHSLVTAAGGTIDAVHRKGGGAIFVVQFSAGKPAKAAKTPAAPKRPPSRRRRPS